VVRRALGFTLARDELLLKQFLAFFEHSEADRSTSELAEAWINASASSPPHTFTQMGPSVQLPTRLPIGLFTASGLRLGEAIGLDRSKVSLRDALLTIGESKFGKSRVLPIHPTMV